MGLFSKRKETEQSNLSLEQVPSFSKLMETPPEPPPQLSLNNMNSGLPPEPPGITSGMPPPGIPGVMLQQAPTLMQPPRGAPENLIPQDVDNFELPDFEDSELSELKHVDEQVQPVEPPMPIVEDKSQSWVSEPVNQVQESLPPPMVPTEMHAFVEEKVELVPEPQRISAAEPDMPYEKFVELSAFFKLKESIAEAKIQMRNMEDEMLAETYKARLAKINSFSSTLNAIQDRIMLIDGKLFEKLEVNS